jgi:hypothetical protein
MDHKEADAGGKGGTVRHIGLVVENRQLV